MVFAGTEIRGTQRTTISFRIVLTQIGSALVQYFLRPGLQRICPPVFANSRDSNACMLALPSGIPGPVQAWAMPCPCLLHPPPLPP
jgi:hypothetical protein